MLALGFSINTLTLFGLVLAIGIVVDDAIIVVENVERIMEEEHLPPREATLKAMEEVSGALIAIVLVLSAVFVPVAFLGGLTGQMYKQFAVTIAVSVAISGVVALTLSPAMAAILLKPTHAKRKNILFRAFDRMFGWITDFYVSGVRRGIRAWVAMLVILGVLCFVTLRMSGAVPCGFLPDEDQGVLLGAVLLPEGSSLDQTQKVVNRVEDYFRKHESVEHVTALLGFDLLTGSIASTNAATIFVSLKSFVERTAPGTSSMDIINDSQAEFAKIAEGVVLTFNPPAIPGLGTRSGFTAELEQRGGGTVTELVQTGDQFLDSLHQEPTLTGLNATLRVTLPQVFVDLNREKAQMLGVRLADVFEPMQTYFGALYVNDFNRFGRIWRVNIQAESEFRSVPQDVERIFVRNDKGEMVRLSAIVNTSFRAGPNVISHYNTFPSIEITGAPAEGAGSGEAIEVIRRLAAETLPPGYGIEWSSASYQEIKAGNQAPVVLGFGLLMVFLVLAAQYERWSLPVAVLLAVPLAVLGALLAVYLRGYTQDIYFQVGLLVLVGLAAKNAILIVEYCVALRRAGRPIFEAAIEASKLRFRPIVMTSLAFILGVVPLAVASGAGAASRRLIGTGVIGGMLLASFVAIFFITVFYVIIQRAKEYFGRRTAMLPNDTKQSEHERP